LDNSSPPSAITAAEPRLRVGAEIVLGGFAVGALIGGLGLPDHALLLTAGGFAVVGVAILHGVARAALGGGFGWANRITLLRALLVAVLFGCLLAPERRDIIAGLAVIAVLSDAVDGWLARRLGVASEFGARFDMETDAALGLVLSLMLVALQIAGPWVLIVGAARYVFVAAGRILPALRRPLPPRAGRRVAAALVMVCLGAATLPFIALPLATALAVAATAITIASFGIDIVLLARREARG